MSLKAVSTGLINEDCALQIRGGAQYKHALAELRGNVKLREVIITVQRATRSLLQNALYWKWNQIISEETGMDPNDVHEFNKSECNHDHFSWCDKTTGELRDRVIPKSTANLSKDAFSEFLERVQRFWATQGYSLPWPDEAIKQNNQL